MSLTDILFDLLFPSVQLIDTVDLYIWVPAARGRAGQWIIIKAAQAVKTSIDYFH